MPMYCSQCGAQLPDGTKFCSECGKPLNNETLAVSGGSANYSIYLIVNHPVPQWPSLFKFSLTVSNILPLGMAEHRI